MSNTVQNYAKLIFQMSQISRRLCTKGSCITAVCMGRMSMENLSIFIFSLCIILTSHFTSHSDYIIFLIYLGYNFKREHPYNLAIVSLNEQSFLNAI